MAANNFINRTCSVLAICIFSFSCQADSNSNETLSYLSKATIEAQDKYESRLNHCNEQVSKNNIPELSKSELTAVNATKKQTLTAIAFFQFRNYFNCERNERLELAFKLGTMDLLKKDLDISADAKELESYIFTYESSVLYPTNKELELKVNYLKLPVNQKKYFESKIGDKPYDLIKALEFTSSLYE